MLISMYYSRVSTTLVACDVPLLSIVTTYTPAAKSASDMLKSPATAACCATAMSGLNNGRSKLRLLREAMVTS